MAKTSYQTILEDGEEHMLRKVHPSQVKDERPSKNTFLPRSDDEQQLSVDRSTVVSAAECYAAYVAAKRLRDSEGGIWAVAVAECSTLHLPCLADPLSAEEVGGPNPAHALIDMRKLDEEAMHNAATELYAFAKARGKLAPA